MYANIACPVRRGDSLLNGLALATSLLVTACGGGSSDSTAAASESAAGSSTESAFWQTAVVGSATGGWTWLMVDPADPAGRRVGMTLATSASPSAISVLTAQRHDASARTVTTLGSSQAFVVDGGKLWRADLRGGQSHQPVTVSTLTDACSVEQVLPLNAAGDDAWLVVYVKAGQSSCSTPMLVRSSWGSSRSAQALGSTRLLSALQDAQGQAVAVLAAVPQGSGEALGVYDTALQTLTTLSPVGSSGTRAKAYFVAQDGARSGSGYVSVNAELRKLDWSTAGVSLGDTVLYRFSSSAEPVALPHPTGLYLADGTAVLNVLAAGGSSQLTSLGTGETMRQISQTSSHLVLASNMDYVSTYVRTVPLTGGSTTVLAQGAMTEIVDLLGVSGDWVVSQRLGGSLGNIRYVRSLADGSQSSELTLLSPRVAGSGDTGAGRIMAATATLGQAPALQAVLTCTPKSSGSGVPCSGPLTQVDVPTLATTALGDLGRGDGYVSSESLQGLPGLANLRDQSYAARDVVLFQPGVAGSLKRLSNNLP